MFQVAWEFKGTKNLVSIFFKSKLVKVWLQETNNIFLGLIKTNHVIKMTYS